MRFLVLPLDWVFEYFEYCIVSSLLTLKLYVLFCLLLSLEIATCTIKIMMSSNTIFMNSVMNFYQYNSLYTLTPYGPYISLLYFLTPNTCYFALNNINILKKHVCTCVNNSYHLYIYMFWELIIPSYRSTVLSGIYSLQSKQLILLFHVLLPHWWWQIYLASLYFTVVFEWYFARYRTVLRVFCFCIFRISLSSGFCCFWWEACLHLPFIHLNIMCFLLCASDFHSIFSFQ